MFDRKFIDLIEVFEFIHIYTANMAAGNKRRENVIKRLSHMDTSSICNALFDTYKGDTISEIMKNPLYKSFIIYYQKWYNNFKR